MLLIGIFLTVLSLTAAGSLGVLLVLGMKKLFGKRLGARWNYLVWLLPLALYLVPVYLPQGEHPVRKAPQVLLPAAGAPAAVPKPVVPGGTALVGDTPAIFIPDLWELCQQLLPALALLWLLGLILSAAVRLADHRRLARSLEKCSHLPEENGRAAALFSRLLEEMNIPQGRVELWLCPGVESPLLLGLWRPRVILPEEDLPEERLEMMLRHELNHYRGRDLWLKAIALVAACIHWFNPLSRWLVRDLDRCCELRCDQRTTAGMGPGDRRQYGQMLLDVAQGQVAEISVSAGAAALAMDKAALKRRLELLCTGGKTGPWGRLLAWVLALTVAAAGVACSAATNPGPEALSSQSAASDGEETPEELEVPTDPPPSQSLEPSPPASTSSNSEPAPAPETEPETSEPPASIPPDQDQPPETPPPAPTLEEDPASPSEPAGEVRQHTAEDYTLPLEEQERLTKDLSWDKTLLWPVDGGKIIIDFYGYYGHTGIDIGANTGTQIYAAADGVVVYATNYSLWPYGKSVIIDHGDGARTRYAHCAEVYVEPGDIVNRGELIAIMGRTGNTSNTALCFELRIDGEPLDPTEYISTP